jgi:hypothetical protein
MLESMICQAAERSFPFTESLLPTCKQVALHGAIFVVVITIFPSKRQLMRGPDTEE